MPTNLAFNLKAQEMGIEDFVQKKKLVSVIGLGYVGLPLALVLAKKFRVIGFDINAARVAQMQAGVDPSQELTAVAFQGADIQFTHQVEDLQRAHFHIVAVPTPIDEHNNPDLTPLLKASQTVGKQLKKGDYVIFESTVYPGCTEEDCVPILERESGLRFGQDFKVGYSPERINPGDKEHTVEKILKVVSGSDAEACELIAQVYGSVIEAGVYRASSIKVADLVRELQQFSITTHLVDPFASAAEVAHEYKLSMRTEPEDNYDAVIIAVAHQQFVEMNLEALRKLMNGKPLLLDLKGIHSRKEADDLNIAYWRL